MGQYLFDGLPPKVMTYIKIHLRYIYSTGLFNYQEREDLIQDLVLFYLDRFYRKNEMPDDYVFIAIKTKALQILRTRLRQMQSGFLNTGSLNSMCEEDGFEPLANFTLADLENTIAIKEMRNFLSDKQNKFIDLLLEGKTAEEARAELHISHTVFQDIQRQILRGKKKIPKK